VQCLPSSPAHIYTYTFEPNPRWQSYYAYAPDIQQYFLDFCEKYKLRKYIKLNHKVISATWHNDKGLYEVQVEHDGKVLTDWCNILINGSGFLNKWKWPSIDGLHSFGGKLLHSAAWDRE
jgi:cation diffusion facilitator CzcD-associated flavoprotein CzcO